MNALQRALRTVDRTHRRNRLIAFLYAVFKKFGDDQGGNLVALITYYGFVSIFPLLLVASTVLGIVLHNDPSLQQRILGSALAQFPVIGQQIQQNVHAMPRSGVALAIGLIVTLYGGLGVVRGTETAMNTVWNVPRKRWPSFLAGMLRAVLMLVLAGVVTIAAALLSGVAGGASVAVWLKAVGIAGSLVLNLILFLGIFRILPSLDLSWGDVLPGACVAAVAWTVLQLVGGVLVAHQLKGSSELYGFFGVVLALLAWISLGAEITILAAEMNVVRKRRLWPRSIVQPPLTDADRRALHDYAHQEERRPEESVHVAIGGTGPAADETAEPKGAGG
jgi:inner membrane protein YhjD